MENPNAATFFLVSPFFSVFFLYSFQSPSLITELQPGVSINLIFLLMLQYLLCSCVIPTGAQTSLHCAAVGSCTPRLVGASVCHLSAGDSDMHTALNMHTKCCSGDPVRSMGHTLQHLLFLLLPMHKLSVFLCLLLSLQVW